LEVSVGAVTSYSEPWHTSSLAQETSEVGVPTDDWYSELAHELNWVHTYLEEAEARKVPGEHDTHLPAEVEE
jgi:hypothetical protein